MTVISWLVALLVFLLALFGASNAGGTAPPARSGAGGEPAPPVTVTRADDGRTLRLPVGGEFLLALGTGTWTVQLSDPAVVARLPNVTAVRGAQGIFIAKQPGKATLSAAGPAGARFRLVVEVT